MLPVKICGITNLADALYCVSSGVPALGFVLAPSPRQVSPAQVREISRQLPPWVIRVGVFVNEDPLVVRELLRDCYLDLAQLHGEESLQATELLPGKVIKAFRAGKDPIDLSWRETPLRAVLVDTYQPNSQGGTGQTFDWSLFGEYRKLGFPLVLAGGLRPENIIEAIRATGADGVDLSSGVELRPGVKDQSKIKLLMEQLMRSEDDEQ